MRTLGLLGGMSWESTAVYYGYINRAIRAEKGGLHSAKILLHSCDFAEMAALLNQDRWDLLAETLAQTAQSLEEAGADCIAICTNTMHKVAPEVQAAIGIPLLDIRDAVGASIRQAGLSKIGLLGTRPTMAQEFFRAHLRERWGIECLIPEEPLLDTVHGFVFEELCQGIIRSESRVQLVAIIEQLKERGAEGIILGCTEFALLLTQKDSPLPLFDTTVCHTEALVAFALGDQA